MMIAFAPYRSDTRLVGALIAVDSSSANTASCSHYARGSGLHLHLWQEIVTSRHTSPITCRRYDPSRLEPELTYISHPPFYSPAMTDSES